MDGERKVNLEGVPLNCPGAANIFLTTGKNTKVNTPNGTVIHLKTEKSPPADVGLHINTTFSIASSKKIKLLFVLNFLLSVVCMVISTSVAFYYWNEIMSTRRQLDSLKDQLLLHSLKEVRPEVLQPGALVSFPKNRQTDRVPRMEATKDETSPSARRYYVDNLGQDLWFIDSSKKNAQADPIPELEVTFKSSKELMVAHFNGAVKEVNLGMNVAIGPWSRDAEVSTKNSEQALHLHGRYVTVNESGLYLVYAQIVYLSHSPNCYFIWARQEGGEPRLLTACSSGDDASGRPLDKSQISCSVQTVARLRKGDQVNLVQRERNRTVWLKPGYSYFGFVKLSS